MFKWSRVGGYQVCSKGDKRFSAFNALMPDGRSIEMHYQCDVKQYDPGGNNWRLGKGKPPLNTKLDLYNEYLNLWKIWANNNRQLIQELKQLAIQNNNTLSDMFAYTDVNQARALSDILNIDSIQYFELTEEGYKKAINWLKDNNYFHFVDNQSFIDGFTTVNLANNLIYRSLYKKHGSW